MAHPHSLPTRAQYERTPSDELIQLLPELSHDLFSQQLTDDQKRAIIETYPPVNRL